MALSVLYRHGQSLPSGVIAANGSDEGIMYESDNESYNEWGTECSKRDEHRGLVDSWKPQCISFLDIQEWYCKMHTP